MRKWIAVLLGVMMLVCLIPAMAEEEADMAFARSEYEKVIAQLAQEAEGWSKLMLERAQITELVRDGKRIKATIVMPALQSGVTNKDKAKDGAEAYLDKAVAPYISAQETWDTVLMATCKQAEDGSMSLKWTNYNAKKLKSTVQSQAKKARQGYVKAEMEKALNAILLPDAADMPSKKPKKTVPEVGPLEDYAAQVAPQLGLTQAQASQRLPALMLLMEITKIDADNTLEEAVLSVTVKNWQGMLDAALEDVKAQMQGMIGVPEMDRTAIESLLCAKFPETLLDSYYTQKGRTTQELTVDIVAVSQQGAAVAQGLMDVYRTYSAQVDAAVDQLSAYAQTLAYYPRVDMIETGLLTGAGVEDGASVIFDLGEDAVNHGYICVKQNGTTVLTGFIQNGVKLAIRLAPGQYQVYCNLGPEWFGEEYLFGKDSYFGVFDLTAQNGVKTVVSMEDAGGNLPVSDMTEADFHAAID